MSAARIAERAGVHRATVHRRWPDLDRLVEVALIESAAAEIPVPDTGDVREDLVGLLTSIAAYIDDPTVRGRIAALVGDAGRSDAIRGVVRHVFATRFQLGEQVLSRGVRRGQLRPDLDPAVTFASLVGPLYVRILLTDERLDAGFVRALVDAVLTGAAMPTRVAPAVEGS